MPNELREKFADFSPIIKNAYVSRSDIGDYMRRIAEKHGYPKKPNKCLINNYFGKKIL